MIKEIIIIAAIGLSLTACQSNSGMNSNTNSKQETAATEKLTDVSFRIAENYFVKNTVRNLDNPKIETAEKFNEIFGMAARMSGNGKPTEIDFSNQYVIAIILPETNLKTILNPVSLQKNGKGEIILDYKITSGEKQTFTTKPFLALILDKADHATRVMVIREQKEQ